MSLANGETESEVLAKTSDGSEIKEVREGVEIERTHKDFSWSYVRTERRLELHHPTKDPITISATRNRYHHRWRRRVIIQLSERVDDFRVTEDRKTVPVNIINEGKPAITSYLYAVHGWDYSELHEMLGITGGTIRQYIMAVVNDNR